MSSHGFDLKGFPKAGLAPIVALDGIQIVARYEGLGKGMRKLGGDVWICQGKAFRLGHNWSHSTPTSQPRSKPQNARSPV